MKDKFSAAKLIRNTIQLICFLFLPGLFIDAFNGIKALVLAVSTGTASFSALVPALFPTVLLILATMLAGRFFCGYMCAFGTLGDAVYYIGKKVFKIKFRMPESLDRSMKWLKYVLFVFLLSTWVLGVQILQGWSAWDAFGSLLSFPPDFTYAFTSLTAGSILLGLIIAGSLFVDRFFCRYFCPMGAVFSVVSMLKIAKIKRQGTDCGKCRACTSACKMGIPLYQKDTISSGNCIDCLACLAACPRKNVKFTVASKDAAPILVSVAAVSMIGLYHAGNIGISSGTLYNQSDSGSMASQENLEDNSEEEISKENTDLNAAPAEYHDEVSESTKKTNGKNGRRKTSLTDAQTSDLSSESSSVSSESASTQTAVVESKSTDVTSGYLDGTYQGSGLGYHNRYTTVEVTISNGEITDVTTISTGDDAQYYNRAFPRVTAEIIAMQDSSVSAVSGATYSSRGIMDAVADALTKAEA